jgi:hypothetical protein
MALINSKVPYLEIRDSLITLLKNNVSILNEDLDNKVTKVDLQILKGNPAFIPTYATLYPYIFVDLISKSSEDYGTLGSGARKNVDAIYNIYVIARDMRNATEDDDQKVYLARNAESILRDNIQFNANILIMNINETDFKIFEANSTYVSGAVITLETRINVI